MPINLPIGRLNVASDDRQQNGRLDYAKTAVSAMRGDVAPLNKDHFIAIVVAVVLLAGAAAAIGATVSPGNGPGKNSTTADGGSFSRPSNSGLPAAVVAAPGPGITNFQVPGSGNSTNGSHRKGQPAQHGASVIAGTPQLSLDRPAPLPAPPAVGSAKPTPGGGKPVPQSSARGSSGSASHSAAVTSVMADGQVSCTSGHPVEGVWIAAGRGSGWASWQRLGNGSTSNYLYTLPRPESYAVHVGCGGSPASWKVAANSGNVPAGRHSFNCVDSPGEQGFGTCELH